MANKSLLGTITVLIGVASLIGYYTANLFTEGFVANDAAVAENDVAEEQTDVEPYIEDDSSIEPHTNDDQATDMDVIPQTAEDSSNALDSGSRPATAEEEAEIRRIAEENGMVATPNGDGFDVRPSDE